LLDLGVLLQIPYVETEMGFDLSPDGSKVAFSWNPGGTWEIFEQDLAGKDTPLDITLGPGGKFHPRYSPDGKKLAYSLDVDGSEHFHIIVRDLVAGSQKDLTPFQAGSLQPNFTWSPDGSQIAFISDRSGQFDVYLMDIDSQRRVPRLVFHGDYPAWKVSWSPDSKWLAVVVEASGIDFGIYVLPTTGGEAVRIREHGQLIDAGQPAWSPDSRCLAFSSDFAGFNNIGVYELASSSITWLTEGEGEKQYPCWSPDGKRLAYILNRGAVSWLAIQKPGDPVELYQVEKGVHYTPVFSQDGRSLILGFDNPRHPTDLWSFAIAEKTFKQITHSLPEGIRPSDFIMPEEVTYPGMDGVPVPALLFLGNNHEKSPVVLVVHGGPDWFFEMTWYPLMAALASRGWTVLAPNYRGSTGYGRAWQEASRFDFGGVDTDDVAAGALFLAREGLADPQRIGITGRSHGGYLTASCLTRYPDLWAVGSAVVPFLNWFTNHEEIRPDLRAWDLENFGDPIKNHDLWYERSPSFFLDRIQAPLQLICGRLDARCPVNDSIQAEKDLRRMGKVIELIIYEDEGHAFLKKENVLDAEQRRVDFLIQHLKEDSPQPLMKNVTIRQQDSFANEE
jgi:dipeptidyl aminopeptidase/acylaminoacyl peptidase